MWEGAKALFSLGEIENRKTSKAGKYVPSIPRIIFIDFLSSLALSH